MHNNAIDIPANPLSSGAPVAGDLAATTGESQGTVAAMLNAQIREEQTNRMMNPSAYGNVSEPYDVVKSAAEKVKVELMHPEREFSDDKPTTTEQAPGAQEYSVEEMNDLDTAADWANSMYPDDDDITGETIAENGTVDAGSVNGDADMTNQSLDFVNSIEPTPEPQGPDVDLVPDEEGADTGEVNEEEEDPTMVAGDEI